MAHETGVFVHIPGHTQKLCGSIWPEWENGPRTEKAFGTRLMFFPMTPAGLNEPGETDLGKQTFAPVGILQPLLWLLHMNGYMTLPSRTEQSLCANDR